MLLLFSPEVSANTALLLTKKYVCNITEKRWEGFELFTKIISYFDILQQMMYLHPEP
ncbi:MAG: hypothetical protein ACTHM5_11085 [Ginsengibacter sp.]